MNKQLKEKLIAKARKVIESEDPSHDISHSQRVLGLAEKIAKDEKSDIDIVIPSALFHDVINYPKDHPKRLLSSTESAEWTRNMLVKEFSYSKENADKVYSSIQMCSFTKGIIPDFIEAKILQDADALEATGAISIMRTFSSGGMMKKQFYSSSDPFCVNRKPNDMKYSLDLFFTRLLVVQKRLHTKTAKLIAKNRHQFLKEFLKQLKTELENSA